MTKYFKCDICGKTYPLEVQANECEAKCKLEKERKENLCKKEENRRCNIEKEINAFYKDYGYFPKVDIETKYGHLRTRAGLWLF